MNQIQNYQLKEQQGKNYLNINWQNGQNTQQQIDLDTLYHLVEKLMGQKNMQQSQIQALEEVLNYINQQQETQLSEQDSRDQQQDSQNLEDHLKQIIEKLFGLDFLNQNQQLLEFINCPDKTAKNSQKSNQQGSLVEQLEIIEGLSQNFQNRENFILGYILAFFGNTKFPMYIEAEHFLVIFFESKNKSYRIPISNRNIQLRWIGKYKETYDGFELQYTKGKKIKKWEVYILNDEFKARSWFDKLQNLIEQNKDLEDSQIDAKYDLFTLKIVQSAQKIIDRKLKKILNQNTKQIIYDEQMQQNNKFVNKIQTEEELILNNFLYLQSSQIDPEMAQKIEDLIVKNNQHTTNCIQNYHEMGIGIKSKREQISRYELEENNTSSIKEDNNKPDFWFSKDYKKIEKTQGQNNGLQFINKEFLKIQDSIYGTMVKKFGKTIFSGQPIFSISMPACMFQAESMLERTAYTFGHNHYLNYAANISDTVEQIKYFTCFYQSSFIIALAQQLPLNPILGETFQGRINGDPIYFEQISHHPPISYYYMTGQNYKLYSPHQPMASLSLTQVEGRQTGHPTFVVNGNKKLYYMWFPIRVRGLVFGDRVVQAAGRCFCFEPEERILCELVYDSNSQKQEFYADIQNSYDIIQGGIYKVTKQCMDKFVKEHKFPSNHRGNNITINLQTDVEQIISKAYGDYKRYLSYDGIRYWNGIDDRPYVVTMENNSLPSDSRYRLDSLAMRQNNIPKADKYKDNQEQYQRNDKKLRIKNQKKRK